VPIRSQCESCGKLYSLKDDLAGKKIRCPACKGVIQVPGAAGAGEGTETRRPAPSAPKPGGSPTAAPGMSPTERRPAKPATSPADAGDPNATAYTPSPVRRKGGGAPAKPSPDGATVCPACGKAMAAKQVTCSQCGYHLKLRRRLAIGEAIRRTDLPPGVRPDGTRFLTRAERAEIRQEQGRKIRWGMLAVVLLLILFVATVSAGVIYYVQVGPALEELRLTVLPPTFSPEGLDGRPNPEYDADRPLSRFSWFHPYCAGMRVKVQIPLGQLHCELPPAVPEGPFRGVSGASDLARVCQLPYFKVDGAIWLPRVLERITDLGGTYGPAKFAEGVRLRDDIVVVWRQSDDPAANGYLDGALLDFGGQQEDAAKLIRAKDAGSALAIEGRLTFLVSRIQDLREGGYAYALRESLTRKDVKLSRIPPLGSGFKAPAGTGPRDDKEMFHPVILVDSHTRQ